ncbi:endonuclease/exonuclease/phosphatase family protein [Corynebacterium oculi]|uniref:Maltose 6'-phosphate phosphatase n=1 Tax=Corynebacterium oculi TaxID=1544416 RepID=A0A0Q0Z476_9CORY|nr:endonuclease/exonuclease/phosphatase family protein [Corynebacterium oculi]KQB84229.1 Maltose 6'-phosphate phosphatase [Corynebacterium oculi]
MKVLSLNAHSWCEPDQPAKIMDTARLIVEEGVDVVAVQEANQLQGGVPWRSTRYGGPSALPMGADNYAQALAEACAHLGGEYRCYWAEAHQGFGKYDEGVGLLVRAEEHAAEAHAVVLAEYPYADVRRRVALALKIRGWGWVLSGHFSWWKREGQALFAQEWEAIEGFARRHPGERVCVAGDLNNPATVAGEGYSLIRQRGWMDTRDLARDVEGHDTIAGKISGWEGARAGARIDYVLVNEPLPVASHRVVFAGEGSPVVSDHYGVLVDMEQDTGKGEEHDAGE